MRKIFYFIIAFLFFAECNNDNQENEYNDGKFTINGEIIFLRFNVAGIRSEITRAIIQEIFPNEAIVRSIWPLYTHLYKNGHIIFRGNQVNNINDLNNIVIDRYNVLRQGGNVNAQQLDFALRRRIISYINLQLDDPIRRYQNRNAVFIQKLFYNGRVLREITRLVFPNVRNRGGNNVNIVSINRVADGSVNLVIDVKMQRNDNWRSVIEEDVENRNGNDDMHFDIRGAGKLRVCIKKPHNQAPFFTTAFIEV